MDPNIMKLLEEDEDETMHSGADVEAFTAELNRDIEGNASTSKQPSDSDSAALSQGGSQTTSHFIPHWQTSAHDVLVNFQSGQDLSTMVESDQKQPFQSDQQQHILVESENRNEDALQHNSSTDDGNSFPVSNPMATQTSQEQSIHIQEQNSESNQENQSQIGKLQNIGNRPLLMESQGQQSLSVGNQDAGGMMMSSSQPTMTSGLNSHPSMSGSSQQQGSALKLNKQVPFGVLLPIIQPQLDKDRAMQLHTLYFKLKKNEITKDGFVRHMRSIVGDQMLKMAVYKLQNQDARNTQTTIANKFQPQPQASARQMQVPSNLSNPTSDGNASQSREEIQSELQVSDRKHPSLPTQQGLNKQQHMHMPLMSFPTYGGTGSSYSTLSATNATPQMRQAPAHPNMTVNHAGATMPHTSMLNVSNFDRSHPLGDPKKIQAGSLTHTQKIGVSSSSSMSHVKQEPADQLIEQRHNDNNNNAQFSSSHGLSSLSRASIKPTGSGGPGSSKDDSFEMKMQSSRTGSNPSASVVPTNSITSSIPSQMETNILPNPIRSITSPISPGNNNKAAPKKPVVGQKKPVEAPPGSSPPSSKKQKVSGGFLDQSIEQLNDVTAVSGVNLREEEEQLFSGPKEESRATEASRRVVQEEEDRLILNKIPLKKKVVEIMAKCGLKNMSSDVDRCLSFLLSSPNWVAESCCRAASLFYKQLSSEGLITGTTPGCVEERMRGLISNVIRLSKQRVDFEKPRHKTIITSDVRQQIMTINRKAREELEKKQADSEKSQKSNDPDCTGVDGDKEKDESRAKSTKANKEEDDKMRATAANVAVRNATGVSDMMSKWQLMIEAKQKQGGSDTSSNSQPGKDTAPKPSSTSSKNMKENHEAEKRDPSSTAFINPGSVRKVGRNQVVVPRVARSISFKDVIAILEKEPQMSKSVLLYRLYNKVRADAVAE
ncbi:hypothetical protein CASFOL_021198 [Castilleja foliolosa]|uniref:RST domain-containing protein n=1 Tax=Castilleja foliolosa TaxID=1961234 RepID=A0ABD3CYH8_9LAMI